MTKKKFVPVTLTEREISDYNVMQRMNEYV